MSSFSFVLRWKSKLNVLRVGIMNLNSMQRNCFSNALVQYHYCYELHYFIIKQISLKLEYMV